MSMYEIEDYIESGVLEAARSQWDIAEKRNFIYSLLALAEYGDCSFIHLRFLPHMISCQYTFLFDKEQMYDYRENKEFYDQILPNKNEFRNGDVYFYFESEKKVQKVCVDSGSNAWKGMVEAGKITKEGAEPVKKLTPLDTLKRAKELFGELDESFMEAHQMLFALTGAEKQLKENEYPEQLGMTKEEWENSGTVR